MPEYELENHSRWKEAGLPEKQRLREAVPGYGPGDSLVQRRQDAPARAPADGRRERQKQERMECVHTHQSPQIPVTPRTEDQGGRSSPLALWQVLGHGCLIWKTDQ